MTRAKWLTAALCVVIFGSAATHAEALGKGWWSANGAACAPGDPAIQANRYTIGAGSVKHQAGAGGLITLYCSVNPGLGGMGSQVVHLTEASFVLFYPGCANGAYSLRQTYTDPDGTATAAYVRSQLYRMSKANGAISPVAYATVNSNGFTEMASTNHSSWFDHVFDLDNYSYYVRVDLDRLAGSTESAIIYSVAIECR